MHAWDFEFKMLLIFIKGGLNKKYVIPCSYTLIMNKGIFWGGDVTQQEGRGWVSKGQLPANSALSNYQPLFLRDSCFSLYKLTTLIGLIFLLLG